MKRIPALVTVVLVVFVSAVPVSAQQEVNPIDVLIDAFSSPEGQEYVAQFLKQPVPGASQVTDPAGDFEHSTGQPPGFTPDHIDILDTWVIDFRPMPVDGFFTPTDQNQFWAPTGMYEVDPPNHDPFQTFTGDIPHDGSQYEQGAVLFGLTLADTPPVVVPGRCEFVVWVNDPTRGETFVNQPSFPGDPAGGTNAAFGLGINPEGQGASSSFALLLAENGSFVNAPEVDVRSFVTPSYVGITVPRSQIGDLAQVNFYTFCVESGFSFAPEETGADQTGVIDVTFDDLGVVSIEPAPVPSSTTTSTTLTETTTTTTATSTTTVSVATAEVAEDGFPWWVLIVGGLGLVGLGWYLLAGGKDPCQELLDAWMAARKACEEAQAAADDAGDDCENAELELAELEDERKELCVAWPPACWTSEDGGWVEDDQGNRITSRDLHMKRMALGAVWSEYQAGNLTAEEVEAKWKDMNTPEFREELRETDQAFKDELSDIDAEMARAEETADRACSEAVAAQERADELCAAAEAAHKAYQECIGAAVAAAGAASSGDTSDGGGAPPGPGGSVSVSEGTQPGKDPCDGVEPKRKHEKAGKTDKIRVNVDFSVITGVAEGSERRIAAGKELTFNLNDLARDLDFIGDMAGARSAGLHVGGAVNGFAQGKYVASGAGVVMGGIDAAMAVDMVPEVPTSPFQAGTEFLEGVSRLGATVANKVTAWMEGQQMMLLWTTMFYQEIEATPYQIWECRRGVGWVCVEKVWEFEVGKLRRHPPNPNPKRYLVDSNLNKARFQAEIRRQSQIAANKIRNDAKRLIEWRAKHEPGPC